MKLKGVDPTTVVSAVIIMVLLVLIGTGFIASAQGVSLRELILGNPAVGEKIEYIEGGIYEEEREIDLTLDKQPVTATLAGCQIAKAITSDFIENGEAERSPIEGTDSTIITHAPFQIKWNAEKNSYWKSGDFAERDSDGDRQTDSDELKRACSDTGEIVYCPANLDEACVASQLKNLRVGADKSTAICTGSSIVIAGGKDQKFGDETCTANGGWTTCSSLCPGGDRIVSWKASGGEDSYISVTGVANDVVRTNDKNFNFKENFPPECKSGAGQNCEPKYEWTVLWNNEKDAYEIEIPRITAMEDLGEISLSNYKGLGYFGSFLASYFNNGDRTNLVGLEQPELRTVYRATFTPTEDYQFNDFVYKDFLQSVSGDYWKVETPPEYCGTCQTTSVPIINYDRKIFGDVEWYESATFHDKLKKDNERKIRLRIGNLEDGILAANEKLKADHKYMVIANRYRGPWFRNKLDEENCDFGISGLWYDNGKFECGGYFQGKNPAAGCKREDCDAYDYYAPIDYSLTVIDMGPLAKTGPEESGTQESDQGKGEAAGQAAGSGGSS